MPDVKDQVIASVTAVLDGWPDLPGYMAAAAVTNLTVATPDAGNMQGLIDWVAEALTKAGVRYPVQVGVLTAALGIRIGGGGGGPNVTTPPCPYCGCYGGGGHGGFCPGPYLERTHQ